MRQIKFRVWSEGSKQMSGWDILRGLHVSTVFVKSEGYHVMQFTGLLDKNGKEIYEGDILKGTGIDGKTIIWEAVSLMNFHHWQETQDLIDEHHDIEVIGNIYENAELIDGVSKTR